MGLGFHGVVGADYDMSDSMVLFAQLKVESLSFKSSDRKMTKATTNGVDRMSSKTKEQKEIKLKDNLGTYQEGAIPTQPGVGYAEIMPANSLSFTVGVGWKF